MSSSGSSSRKPYVSSYEDLYIIGDIHGDIKALILCLRDMCQVIKKTKLITGEKYDGNELDIIIGDDEERLLMPIDHPDYDKSLGYEWVANPTTRVICTGDLLDNKRDGKYYQMTANIWFKQNETIITKQRMDGNYDSIRIPYNYGKYYVGKHKELESYIVNTTKFNYQRFFSINIYERKIEMAKHHKVIGISEDGQQYIIEQTDDLNKYNEFYIENIMMGYDEYIHEEMKIIELLNCFEDNIIKILGNHEYCNISLFPNLYHPTIEEAIREKKIERNIMENFAKTALILPLEIRQNINNLYDLFNFININKRTERVMMAENYISDFALSFCYFDDNRVIPRQCIFDPEVNYGFSKFGEEPRVLYVYRNFIFMHGGMGKFVESIIEIIKRKYPKDNILNKINMAFYDYLVFGKTGNKAFDNVIYNIMYDRTFGEIESSYADPQNYNNRNCLYLEQILTNINSAKGNTTKYKIDTMIIGHCPQYSYYLENDVPNVPDEYYQVYGQIEDKDLYVEHTDPVDTRSQLELYNTDPPKLGITMGCPLNENNHKLYRIDVGMSRAFDPIKNNNCADLDGRMIYIRRPQILRIKYEDISNNKYKISVLKTSAELMEMMQKRQYCVYPYPQEGGYKKYMKYVNKIAKLKSK